MIASSYTIIDKISEPFTLIWLNPSVNNKENLKIQQFFLPFITYLKTFININECEQYIKSSSTQEQFVFIVTGQMGRDIVPRIHKLQQILSIYIFCMDKNAHEKWSKEYKKVKSVIVEAKELIDLIRIEHDRRNHNKANELFSISIFKNNIEQEEIINGPNSEFLYMKCLIDLLLQLKPIGSITDEFLYLCQENYENNQIELDNIREFEKNYSSNQALLWYTKNIFIKKILNKSFYNQNIDLLFLSRFFIHDLQQEIKQKQLLKSIQVYRSQLISKNFFEKLQNSIGDYILISSFFSANINREQELLNFNYINNTENFEQILFEINANPLTSFCYSLNQEEILFNLGSIFHLIDIQLNDKQIWIIRIILCNNIDLNLKSIKINENYWTTDLLLFGTILQQKNKYFEAEKFYRFLLNELPHDHQDIDACYYSLGLIADENEDYDSSLKYYQLSLEILLRKNQLNHFYLGKIYYMIGEIYRKTNLFNEALDSYNKALKIWKDILNFDQIKIAECLNNIALIYRIEKKYLESISYYIETLSINEKYLPINHMNLGILNHNIGALHWCLGHYNDAIKYYNQALEIKYKSISSQHLSIAMTLENLGLVYENNEDYQQALSYYEQAAKIYRETLSQTHSDVIQIDEALRRVSSKL